jgi:N-hydroxyarylamine O-acetyltransferase
MTELAAYLERIGFQGTARPDLATLTAVHRLHADSIPYENLDVQLGRPVSTDPREAFQKIVLRRRGGWCYEMNGLLGWALEKIGFRVTRLAGGVFRAVLGDAMTGNHLVLLVHLDRPYVADVGFGDGLIEPVPLEAGPIRQRFLDFRLESLDGGWWRFHNDPRGSAPSFDFQLEPADEDLFRSQCSSLQTNPESPFVLNVVCQRHSPSAIKVLRGRVLKTISSAGVREDTLGSREEFAWTLKNDMGLEIEGIDTIWAKVVDRHRVLFGE